MCGICYTLQLTERFSQSKFEIINSTNIETGETFQYLKVDNMVLQPMEGVVKNVSECPSTWISQRIYDMEASPNIFCIKLEGSLQTEQVSTYSNVTATVSPLDVNKIPKW